MRWNRSWRTAWSRRSAGRRSTRAALVAASGESAVAAFEFRLHRLQFLHTLQTAGGAAALVFPFCAC